MISVSPKVLDNRYGKRFFCKEFLGFLEYLFLHTQPARPESQRPVPGRDSGEALLAWVEAFNHDRKRWLLHYYDQSKQLKGERQTRIAEVRVSEVDTIAPGVMVNGETVPLALLEVAAYYFYTSLVVAGAGERICLRTHLDTVDQGQWWNLLLTHCEEYLSLPFFQVDLELEIRQANAVQLRRTLGDYIGRIHRIGETQDAHGPSQHAVA